MSFKLQDVIQKTKGIPGRYKRVLLSAASHARKDGTNIWASKETLGDGAGVSRWTAYRNIDPLIEKGILVEADTHTCANPNCPKGSKHSTGRGNHWTQAYNIDLVALQNATWESKKSRSKMQQSGVAKCLTSGVAKCDANRGVREARFTGSVEARSSVVSEVVSEGDADSLRSSAILGESKADVLQPTQTETVLAKTSQKQNQEQPLTVIHPNTPFLSDIWLARTGKPFTDTDCIIATELIAQHGYRVVDAVLDITLNRREKSAKMVWRRFKVFADNWETNYDLGMSWVAYAKARKTQYREIPPKFEPMTIKRYESMKADEKKSREYFRDNCKVGDWTLTAEDWKATGAYEEHFMLALEFCCENQRRVTKAEFITLIHEATGAITADEPKATGGGFADLCPECGWENIPSNFKCICDKPKAKAAGAGFEPEEAE